MRRAGFSSEINTATEAYETSSRDKANQRRLASVVIDLTINKWSYRVFIIPLMKIAFRFSSQKGVAEQLEAVSTHDAANRLGMIKASTLVITGTEDRAIKPISSEVIASLVPNAKLVKSVRRGTWFHYGDTWRIQQGSSGFPEKLVD